jgi:hypothetical protein
MAPQICTKDPDETVIYTMDWTNRLNSGASVSSINATTGAVGSPSGLTFASTSIVSGSTVKTSTKISGGTNGTDYTVTWTVTTSDGETLEESGLLRVRSSAG